MTSRFFQASDSSESDSDEQELYSDGEEGEAKAAGSDAESDDSDEDSDDMTDDSESSSDDEAGGASRFLKADKDDSSGEEADEAVVAVRSQKDKRNEEAEAVIRTIENAVKINDWAVTLSEFDKLNRLVPGWVKSIDGRNPKSYSMCAVVA
jgi:translation initiation factor 3 subunit C